MESESFERLMKMISCFLCSTWVGKWVTAVTSYSSLTASRLLAVVDRTYDCLGLSTARGRTRKQTLRHCGLVRSFHNSFTFRWGVELFGVEMGFELFDVEMGFELFGVEMGFELFDVEMGFELFEVQIGFELFEVQMRF